MSQKNWTKWTRINSPDPDQTMPLTKLAELETGRDLQKPVQQLLCDVHEEVNVDLPPRASGETEEHWNQVRVVLQLQRLVGAQKRMVSMMGRVALEHEHSSTILVRLTGVL